jgi:hypothetical protein
MTFKEIQIGQVFFENETGEYHLKTSDKQSAVIDKNKKYYYTCEFEPTHPVELEENFFN